MADKALPFRLTRLRIKNFRSIGEVDIALGPLTVLIGPNGSGKSNVVDALRFLRDCFTRGLDQAILDREGMTVLRRWTSGSKTTDISLGITVSNDAGNEMSYDFVLSSHAQQAFYVKKEELLLEGKTSILISVSKNGDNVAIINGGKKQVVKSKSPVRATLTSKLHGPSGMMFLMDNIERNSRKPEKQLDLLDDRLHVRRYGWTFQRLIDDSLFYILNPIQLRAPQRMVQETPFDESGQNLSAVLQYLHRHRRSADDMRQTLARLVAGITDFSVETTGSYLVTYLHYKNNAGYVRKADLGQESDGTLRVLGILAALNQRKIGNAIMPLYPFLTIEEPEVNIHPGMLAVLAELFQEASIRQQLLLTTHSPDLLDFLPPESFVVVEKIDGETKAGELAADQAEIIRQRLFSPGELLRSEGLHRQPEATTDSSAAV
ncbi:AAA family ATPase [Hymenobacter sp. UYP22]|uniref:AAA family ATPase n=1 Tax=Hymenobacter sp. UYP22 TaxID=3156348 RepID=UPI00339ACEA1